MTVLGTENAMGLSDELFLGLSVTEMDSWGEGRQTEGVRWHGARCVGGEPGMNKGKR